VNGSNWKSVGTCGGRAGKVFHSCPRSVGAGETWRFSLFLFKILQKRKPTLLQHKFQ
jgi:hypothetical protein